MAQEAAKRMKSGSVIINVSDVGAHKMWSSYSAYVTIKSAVETLTRLLAKTYFPGISVNTIAPGLVLPSENVTDEGWQNLVDRLPLKRPVSLGEITTALEFILINDAIIGQVIVVDGGYSLI